MYRNSHTTPNCTLLNPLLKRFNRRPTLFQSHGAFEIFSRSKKGATSALLTCDLFAWFYTMCSPTEVKAVELWFNDRKTYATFFL